MKNRNDDYPTCNSLISWQYEFNSLWLSASPLALENWWHPVRTRKLVVLSSINKLYTLYMGVMELWHRFVKIFFRTLVHLSFVKVFTEAAVSRLWSSNFIVNPWVPRLSIQDLKFLYWSLNSGAVEISSSAFDRSLLLSYQNKYSE